MFACLDPWCMWLFIKEVSTIPQHSYLYCPSNQCSSKHFLICSTDHIFSLWKQIKMFERMKVDGDSYCQAPTSKSMHYKSVPYGLCTIFLLNRLKFMQSFIFPSNPSGKSPLQLHLMPKRHLCIECSLKKRLCFVHLGSLKHCPHLMYEEQPFIKIPNFSIHQNWHVSNSPAAFITRYTSKLYDVWTSAVAEKSQFNLQKPLMSREQRTRLISVNFSPQVRLSLSSHTYVNIYRPVLLSNVTLVL